MKKIIYIILFTIFFTYNCFSFSIDNCYWIRTPNDVIKIGNKIGMLFGDTYQIRDINDFILNSDWWYKTEFCGIDMNIIFGSNYFAYYSTNKVYYPDSVSNFNFGSSFLAIDEYEKYIKDSSSWILKCSTKVKVPDYLEETGKNGKTIYNVFDTTHFYYFSYEIFTQLFRANSIPWATSKDPDKMIIDVEFLEETDSLVILNGFVNPEKKYLYKANRRLKKIKITSPESDFVLIDDFEDVVHFHEIKLPKKVKKLSIEILDYYEGNRYKDLCVQMIGTKNSVFEDRIDYINFDDLSYNGNYKQYE